MFLLTSSIYIQSCLIKRSYSVNRMYINIPPQYFSLADAAHPIVTSFLLSLLKISDTK